MLHSEAEADDDRKLMLEEVRKGVKTLKWRKAPGVCGVLSEMLKAGGEVVVLLFNMVWRVGIAQQTGEKSVDHPHLQEGSTLECSNYRGISLLSVVGKMYAGVLNDRVSQRI